MRAVVSDLYGTLTDPAVELTRRVVVGRTAQALGIDEELFWRHLRASWGERITGRRGGTAETLGWLSAQCGGRPTAEQAAAALVTHLAGARELRTPRAGAVEVLTELRRRGHRLAVVSDCTSEVAEEWASSPYADLVDVAVLSWREGCAKPDPRLYAAAAERLGVPAAECWYVGDGGGRELGGALRAGMTPVLITNAAVPHAARGRIDADDYTPALQIDDLPDLLDLVGAPSPAPPPSELSPDDRDPPLFLP